MKEASRHGRPRAIAAALALVVCTTGCASNPGPSHGSSTQYKGDAVWNISSRQDRQVRPGPG